MAQAEAQAKWEAELAQADRSRAAGNEGMARVCARRAAGVAVREFFLANGQPVRSTSAVDLLEQIRTDPSMPIEVHTVVEHLLQRVTPDYNLPIEADLIAEARWLINVLQNLPYAPDTTAS